MTKKKVIIDTDPGIDDSLAIMAAMQVPSIEVLALTTVAGNKDQKTVTQNASSLSTYFGSEVPVYQGAGNDIESIRSENFNQTIDGGDIHGENGLGGIELPLDETVLKDTHAVDFILDTIRENPGEVDIIALGPLTNIALCIEKNLETMTQVRSIHSMGGGVHKGNRTPVAEFNYWFDPVAVDEVYTKLGEQVPIHMIGLDVTHQAIINPNDTLFIKYAGGDLGKIISEMLDNYFESYWNNNGYIGAAIHDLMAVVGYQYPEIYTDVYHCHVRCVTDSELARGQVIADLNNQYSQGKNAHIPLTADSSLYKEKFVQMLLGEEAEEAYKTAIENQGL